MPASAIVAQGAIGSQRDHAGRARMQLPIVLSRSSGRGQTTRKATPAIARMRRGNGLFQRRIRESLTTFDLIIPDKGPPAGVHVGVARDLRIMIPREVPVAERVPLVRDYVLRNFVAKGMVADICFHNYITASDGLEQPHAHCLMSLRPLVAEGFGNKSRHEWVPDPSGRTHPDGRPVMIESNPHSWNSAAYFERCREDWEKTANAALERAGSAARIDRRSLLERGLSRLPEPMLGAAFHMRELYGRFKDRFGQYLVARHAREVEQRAKVALDRLDVISPAEAMRTVERFRAWFDRQLDHLPVGRDGPTPQLSTSFQSPDMER